MVLDAMPDVTIRTPDWLRQIESILEELNEGVIIVDSQLHVVFANETLIRLGGYEWGDLQGRTPEGIFPPEDLPYIMKQHETGQRYRRHRHEFYVPRKDGGKVPAIFSARVIQGPDGKEYVLLIVTDISAQKRVEEQLRESNRRLEKRQMEIEAELSLAARVQQSLAPRSLVWNDVAVEAYYSPARTIGGDFGVVLPQGDELLSLLVCDVSGHGIGSALVANRIYSEPSTSSSARRGPACCCGVFTTSCMTASRRTVFTSRWPPVVLSSAAGAWPLPPQAIPRQCWSRMVVSACSLRKAESSVASAIQRHLSPPTKLT